MAQQAKPFKVLVHVHRPESPEGSGQWAASTVASPLSTKVKGLFAWGDTLDAAVEELCGTVYDFVHGPQSPYKTAAEFTGVRATVVYDFEPTSSEVA